MSGVILQYSAFFIICNFLLQINFQILAGVGRIQERVKILSVGLVVNIVFNLLLIRTMGVVGSALAVGISWIPIWYLSHHATRMYSNGFDKIFFIKNLLLSIIIGGISWYFVTPLFVGTSRAHGLGLLLIISIITAIPFVIVNLSE